MLDTRRLMMLREVAAAGSVAAAARALGYTRSAVSQQLSALEAEAGVALLDRSGRRVALTSAGRTLVDHTERILVELRAARAALDGASTNASGLLRVGIPFREGPSLLATALTQARAQHPDLEIRLEATSDQSGAEQVRRNRLDIVVLSRYGTATSQPLPGLREYHLGSDPLQVCLPAEHPRARQQFCSLPQLAEEKWVVVRGGGLGQLVQVLCAAAGFEPQLAATVDDVGTALGLVAIGWGVTLAPQLTPVHPEDAVARLPLAGPTLERHYVLVVRDGEQLSPRVAPVLDAVRAVGRTRLGPARPS